MEFMHEAHVTIGGQPADSWEKVNDAVSAVDLDVEIEWADGDSGTWLIGLEDADRERLMAETKEPLRRVVTDTGEIAHAGKAVLEAGDVRVEVWV